MTLSADQLAPPDLSDLLAQIEAGDAATQATLANLSASPDLSDLLAQIEAGDAANLAALVEQLGHDEVGV